MQSLQIVGQNEPTYAPQRRWEVHLFAILFVGVLAVTPLVVLAGAVFGFLQVLSVGVVLAVLIVILRWPVMGVYLVVACATLVEQDPLTYHIGTDSLYIFHWPTNLAGLPERPIGFLVLFVLLVYILRCIALRQRAVGGGPLLWAYLAFLACVALGVVHGLQTGGQFKIIVNEVRPLWYFFLAYLLAYNLMSHQRQIRVVLWILVLGTAVKGIQGTYVVFVVLHGHLSDQNEIMNHEQSFFFVAVMLIIVLSILHTRDKPLLIAALLSLPCDVIALVANNRRADYVALALGIVVMWVLVTIVKPRARKGLVISLTAFLLLGAAYVVAFSHDGGTLGKPANALISVISPSTADTRDQASNLYRQIEYYDERVTAKQSPIVGYGFGKPYLQPIMLPDIESLDPLYLYVGDNTIYWIWVRLGLLGFAALWYLFGSMMTRMGMILRRLHDPDLQFYLIFALTMTVLEVVLAYADYQLFFYRNVFLIGTLVAIAMRVPAMAARESTEGHDSRGLDVAGAQSKSVPQPCEEPAVLVG